jgi:hypothetical protein
VELTRLEYPNLDDATWRTVPRRTAQVANLQNLLDQTTFEADKLFDALFGEDALLAGWPHVEDLAAGSTPDAGEPLDPDDPDGGSRQGAARSWLSHDASAKDLRRAIRILQDEGLDTEQVETFFVPMLNGAPVRFPVRCREADRDVHFDLPLVFVADLDLGDPVRERFRSLSDPLVLERVHDFYTGMAGGAVDVAGVQINLSPVGDAVAPSDVHEVYRLNIVGNSAPAGGFLPSLGRAGDAASWTAEVALPTMRTLLGSDPRVRVRFDDTYLSGVSADIPLRILGEVVPGAAELESLAVDFTANADRCGGLAAPKYLADGISRLNGLVNVVGSQSLDPVQLFSEGASLFGFDLRELVRNLEKPPEVVTVLTPGAPPEVRMTWKDVDLAASAKGFTPLFDNTTPDPDKQSKLTLTVVSSPTLNESTCTVSNFKLTMPPGDDAIIELRFAKVEFRQRTGEPPTLELSGLGAEFVGKLQLLQKLQESVGLGKLAPQITPSPSSIVARYAIPVPDVQAFSLVMSNLTFNAGLTVPFKDEPVAVSLGFASRERPFTLTVLMFGGGGYMDLELVHTGLRRLEISLQFGAAIAMNFGIAQAEVHAFGGIRFELVASNVMLTGFIHIGGSVELLGLVSVSVEIQVELSYQFDTKCLVGRAKVVVELDVTLYSDSIELDSGDWVIAGGPTQPPVPPSRGPAPADLLSRAAPDPAALQAWREYRGAFA